MGAAARGAPPPGRSRCRSSPLSSPALPGGGAGGQAGDGQRARGRGAGRCRGQAEIEGGRAGGACLDLHCDRVATLGCVHVLMVLLHRLDATQVDAALQGEARRKGRPSLGRGRGNQCPGLMSPHGQDRWGAAAWGRAHRARAVQWHGMCCANKSCVPEHAVALRTHAALRPVTAALGTPGTYRLSGKPYTLTHCMTSSIHL